MLHNIVIPVFLVILVGYLLGKYHKKLNIDSLVFLLIYITGPALIFTSLAKSNLMLREFFMIILAASLIIIISGLVVFIIFKLANIKYKGLYLPMTIGNTGYLGYPIALAGFGLEGLSRAIVYDTTGALFLYSFGIFIAHEKNEPKEIFRVPLIYALIFGILFGVLKISVPEIIFKPLEMIGTITIPLALIVLGYKLTTIKISHFNASLFASLFKIIGVFLIAYFIVLLLPVNGISKAIILLQASMPSAVMSMVLCQKYRRDPEIVASVVMVSTILSLIAVPLVLWIL